MRLTYIYTFIIFLLLIVNSFILHSFNEDIDSFRIYGMNIYNAISLLFVPLAFWAFLKKMSKENNKDNKFILWGIYLYCFYQILVNLPISFVEYPEMERIKYFSQLSFRFFFLLIPVFYFYLMEEKKYNSVFRMFHFMTLLLILAGIYKYTQDIYFETNTGSVRIVNVIASLYFMVTLTDSFILFGARKNRFGIAAIAILGMLLTGHRSVYLTVFLLLIGSIFIATSKAGRGKTAILTLIVISVVILLFAQIPFLSDIFVKRAEYTFDTDDANYQDRTTKNMLALATFVQNPLNGTNLSGYYYPAGEVEEEFFWVPHNFIFDIMATQGLTGLILILGGIIIPIIRIGIRNKHDPVTKKALFIVFYYLIISLANATFFTNSCTLVLVTFSAIILTRNKEMNKSVIERDLILTT
jgi:O-antigen ligase